MASPRPRIFSIPASVPFLPALIKALMQGRLVPGFLLADDPLSLATATIYLPTRRACRLARDEFLAATGRDAAILPRLVPIGGVDDDEIAFAEAASALTADAVLDLPPELGPLERRLLLAELILKWSQTPEMRRTRTVSRVANTPAAALALANDLARLIDDMITRQVPWDRLDGLVPTDVDEYWQTTLRFLQIARDAWPAILAERGAIEPAEHRDLLIEAEERRLIAGGAPVIAAGSTGSMPATARLIKAIAGLSNGAVVLPGLDTDLDADSWRLIASESEANPAYGHPQFAMHGLLRRIGVDRDAVEILEPPRPHGREPVVSEALRPAAATELWQRQLTAPEAAGRADAAFDTITVIETSNAEDEALAIAVALREAFETPGKTAALVTPDRTLARRVLAALARWSVPVDDSGGDPLSDTPQGVYARLAAKAALGGFEPVTLLALLKHPLCPLDRHAVTTLERAILRGPRPKGGTAGLKDALTAFRAELDKLRRKEESELHRSDPRVTLRDGALDDAMALVAALHAAAEPLESITAKRLPLSEIAASHLKVLDNLGGLTEQLVEALDELHEHGLLVVEPRDYPDLFQAAIADRPMRRPERNVRVRIFGPLESRLQSVDRLVLGGMVEGVWPPDARTDPWLSRPMRQALGLDLPERRIGLSAHDFAQALGAPEIVITRAARVGGAPTVASRFVQRLAAIAGKERWTRAQKRGERYLALAHGLDAPGAPSKPIQRPAPKPPLQARPKRLSVTEIEHWLRDPYTIYAKHVLKLAPLDAVDTPPGVADRGTVIHAAVGEFAKTFADGLPDDPRAALMAIGERHFAPLAQYPEASAFWWPRFERIARWFTLTFEPERRTQLARLLTEVRGEIPLLSGEHDLLLSARADRIERRADGSYAILDYKTGSPPTDKQVRTGLAPQLTLEAAIVRRGGFKDIPAGTRIAELAYVRLSGGSRPGELRSINFKDSSADEDADRAIEQLIGLAQKFAQEDQPYLSLVHPMWKTRYGDYDHLARVKEWSLTAGVDDADLE